MLISGKLSTTANDLSEVNLPRDICPPRADFNNVVYCLYTVANVHVTTFSLTHSIQSFKYLPTAQIVKIAGADHDTGSIKHFSY